MLKCHREESHGLDVDNDSKSEKHNKVEIYDFDLFTDHIYNLLLKTGIV